ncbi:MAG TPA: hypothetical protein VGK59_21900 [Ohtaekwangia sp.]
MKKPMWILTAVLGLVSAFLFSGAQDKNAGSSDYVILRYYPVSGSSISVFAGGAELEPVECRKKNINNCVVELLSKYSDDGYEMVSTTTAATAELSSGNAYENIFIFLKKPQ